MINTSLFISCSFTQCIYTNNRLLIISTAVLSTVILIIYSLYTCYRFVPEYSQYLISSTGVLVFLYQIIKLSLHVCVFELILIYFPQYNTTLHQYRINGTIIQFVSNMIETLLYSLQIAHCQHSPHYFMQFACMYMPSSSTTHNRCCLRIHILQIPTRPELFPADGPSIANVWHILCEWPCTSTILAYNTTI